jgi:hypothetical protein
VQFDAVQTTDRINITIGDQPATILGDRSLSVFFRTPDVASFDATLPSPLPEIGVYTPSNKEADTGLRSSISAPFEWHNYAVRFNLREKRLTVWVDRQCRGTIDLANVNRGMEDEPAGSWANLPWTGQYITIGGYAQDGSGRVWTDNFRVGSPREAANSLLKKGTGSELTDVNAAQNNSGEVPVPLFKRTAKATPTEQQTAQPSPQEK